MYLAYGFVEFEDRRSAEDAMHQENGRKFMGARTVVEWSKGCKNKNGGCRYDQNGCHDHDQNCNDWRGQDD